MLSGRWEDIKKGNKERRKKICGTVGIAGKMQRDGDGDRSQYQVTWEGKKTLQRILQRFWWLGISKDVSFFSKACSKCQIMSSRKVFPVPMIPLPVMEVPFQRIQMDVVGPLCRSRTGNLFVLVG